MSKQIYWGVVRAKKVSKNKKVWPMRFHFRAGDAKLEAMRWNDMEKRFRKPAKFIVQRFLFETKDAVHYDIYKHEVKRI